MKIWLLFRVLALWPLMAGAVLLTALPAYSQNSGPDGKVSFTVLGTNLSDMEKWVGQAVILQGKVMSREVSPAPFPERLMMDGNTTEIWLPNDTKREKGWDTSVYKGQTIVALGKLRWESSINKYILEVEKKNAVGTKPDDLNQAMDELVQVGGAAGEPKKGIVGAAMDDALKQANALLGGGGKAPSSFKKNQASIYALLVREVSATREAGACSHLSATFIPESGDRFDVGFNQPVGKDMDIALGEVMRGIKLKYPGWPRDSGKMTFGFDDKYSGKDGPSASVACAALFESLIQGFDIDPKVAVTGDLNANFLTQPVGGVPAKMRGAIGVGCTVMGIPEKNVRDMVDLALDGEVDRIAAIQLISLATMEDALAIVRADRAEPVRKAMEEFALVQKVYKEQGRAILRNAKVQEKLGAVLTAMPNHVGAKILMHDGRGSLPKTYSASGTLMRLDQAVEPVMAVLNGPAGGASVTREDYQKAFNALARLKVKADPRIVDFIASVDRFVSVVGDVTNTAKKGARPSQMQASMMQAAGQKLKSESLKMKENKSLVDELLK